MFFCLWGCHWLVRLFLCLYHFLFICASRFSAAMLVLDGNRTRDDDMASFISDRAVYVSVVCFGLSVCLSVCLSVSVSVSLSLSLSLSLSFSLSLSLSLSVSPPPPLSKSPSLSCVPPSPFSFPPLCRVYPSVPPPPPPLSPLCVRDCQEIGNGKHIHLSGQSDDTKSTFTSLDGRTGPVFFCLWGCHWLV